MAKTQKFTESQLLDAVVRYADATKRAIKATELADWCRKNIMGLEEVRDYHFTRTMRVRDEKTGKMCEIRKPCTIKIEEINKYRSLTANVNANLLLKASSIDAFFNQPLITQRKIVAETRDTVNKLQGKNVYLERENEILRTENNEMKSVIQELSDTIKSFKKTQDKLSGQVSYLLQVIDDEDRKKKLEQMGFGDGFVDLVKYDKSLHQKESEILDIDNTLKKYLKDKLEAEQKHDSFVEDVMSGIKK